MKMRNYLLLLFINQSILSFSQTTLILQPDSAQGKDAVVYFCNCSLDTVNFGDSEDFVSANWSFDSTVIFMSSLVEFDLTGIPLNATINSSYLSLYHNPNSSSGIPGHSQLGGSNQCNLYRIINPWNEHTIDGATLVNIGQNWVTLPASTTSTQDYLNIDVTTMIQDMILNPNDGYGFLIHLVNWSPVYRSMLFASSDHPDPTLHPKLEITYTAPVSIDSKDRKGEAMSIYPNPSTGEFIIATVENITSGDLDIYNATGEKVYSSKVRGNNFRIHPGLPQGIYMLNINNGKQNISNRIVVE